ncbi:MAG: hypothetical protein JWN79_2557, partial [Gemmatimonadetes bacterium]|nr:hypothetical protein [Gemmatimonadota bacterium]
DARSAHAMHLQARTRADAVSDPSVRARIDSLAPSDAAGPRGGARTRRAQAGSAVLTLDGVSAELLGAAMAMQSADVAPTADQLAAASRAKADYTAVMQRWRAVSGTPRTQ